MLFRLLLLLLLLGHEASAQRSFLFIKKRGIKKVDTYYEGSPIRIRAEFGYVEGYITRIKSDSLFINTLPISFADIREVIIRPKKKDPYLKEQLLYTAAGMAITTTGMTLAKWTDWRTALATSASIAGASYVPRLFGIFKRRRYRIGKKFALSPIDLQFKPVQKTFQPPISVRPLNIPCSLFFIRYFSPRLTSLSCVHEETR